jgi:hypothetical protein
MTHEFSHDAFEDAARAFPSENPMEEALPAIDGQGDFTEPSPEFKHHLPHIYWAGEVRRHQPPKPVSNYRSQNERALDDLAFGYLPPIRRKAEVYSDDWLKAENQRQYELMRAPVAPPSSAPPPVSAPPRKRSFLEWFRRMRCLAVICTALRFT